MELILSSSGLEVTFSDFTRRDKSLFLLWDELPIDSLIGELLSPVSIELDKLFTRKAHLILSDHQGTLRGSHNRWRTHKDRDFLSTDEEFHFPPLESKRAFRESRLAVFSPRRDFLFKERFRHLMVSSSIAPRPCFLASSKAHSRRDIDFVSGIFKTLQKARGLWIFPTGRASIRILLVLILLQEASPQSESIDDKHNGMILSYEMAEVNPFSVIRVQEYAQSDVLNKTLKKKWNPLPSCGNILYGVKLLRWEIHLPREGWIPFKCVDSFFRLCQALGSQGRSRVCQGVQT